MSMQISMGKFKFILKMPYISLWYLISVTTALKVAGSVVMGSYTVQTQAIKHFGISLSKYEMSASWVLQHTGILENMYKKILC